jgi:glutaredoxin
MFQIITKPDCPICDQAKKLLAINNTKYTEYQIGKELTREDVLVAYPGAKVVPIMILNNQVIGGIPELQKLVEDKLI